MTSKEESEGVRKVDPRFKELADAFVAARSDRGNYKSALMKTVIAAAVQLLDTDDGRAKRELLTCLEELRRVVEGHQQTDVSAIIEDF